MWSGGVSFLHPLFDLVGLDVHAEAPDQLIRGLGIVVTPRFLHALSDHLIEDIFGHVCHRVETSAGHEFFGGSTVFLELSHVPAEGSPQGCHQYIHKEDVLRRHDFVILRYLLDKGVDKEGKVADSPGAKCGRREVELVGLLPRKGLEELEWNGVWYLVVRHEVMERRMTGLSSGSR
jgi:hypothetical protein